jgi:hypothetical protein
VIFTGRVTEEDLRAERPAEYARLAAGHPVTIGTAPKAHVRMLGRVLGSSIVLIGLTLVGLIVYALLK